MVPCAVAKDAARARTVVRAGRFNRLSKHLPKISEQKTNGAEYVKDIIKTSKDVSR